MLRRNRFIAVLIAPLIFGCHRRCAGPSRQHPEGATGVFTAAASAAPLRNPPPWRRPQPTPPSRRLLRRRLRNHGVREPVAEELKLDTVYLMDVDGRLGLTSGMTMDKFHRQIYLDSQALRGTRPDSGFHNPVAYGHGSSLPGSRGVERETVGRRAERRLGASAVAVWASGGSAACRATAFRAVR